MLTSFMRYRPVMLALCLLASGCIPAPRAADLSPPSFQNQPQFALDVAEIRVRNEYVPAGGNHVEQRFRTTPAQGVDIWTRDRLRAAGADGLLEVVIEEAGVVETPLPVKPGIAGAFTKEPATRYDGVLEVELRLYKDGRAISKSHVDARVAMTREILEKAAVSEYDELYAAMTREMVNKLDAQLTHGMREYMANYMVNN